MKFSVIKVTTWVNVFIAHAFYQNDPKLKINSTGNCKKTVNLIIWVNEVTNSRTSGSTKPKVDKIGTHIVVESLGLAGMFTCLPSIWSCTVQIPEYTAK